MGINERGEFIREEDVPTTSEDPERQTAINQARALAERQDQEPDTDAKITAEKKAAMKRRLLSE